MGKEKGMQVLEDEVCVLEVVVEGVFVSEDGRAPSDVVVGGKEDMMMVSLHPHGQ